MIVKAVFLLLSVLAHADEKGTYISLRTSLSAQKWKPGPSVENAIWTALMKCRFDGSAPDGNLCLRKTLSSTLNELELLKIAEFTSLGFEVSELHHCSDGLKEKIQKYAKPKDFLCFHIFGNKSAMIGAVYFATEKGQKKILKIKY